MSIGSGNDVHLQRHCLTCRDPRFYTWICIIVGIVTLVCDHSTKELVLMVKSSWSLAASYQVQGQAERSSTLSQNKTKVKENAFFLLLLKNCIGTHTTIDCMLSSSLQLRKYLQNPPGSTIGIEPQALSVVKVIVNFKKRKQRQKKEYFSNYLQRVLFSKFVQVQ